MYIENTKLLHFPSLSQHNRLLQLSIFVCLLLLILDHKTLEPLLTCWMIRSCLCSREKDSSWKQADSYLRENKRQWRRLVFAEGRTVTPNTSQTPAVSEVCSPSVKPVWADLHTLSDCAVEKRQENTQFFICIQVFTIDNIHFEFCLQTAHTHTHIHTHTHTHISAHTSVHECALTHTLTQSPLQPSG